MNHLCALTVLLTYCLINVNGFNTRRPGPFQGLKVSCKTAQEFTLIKEPGCISKRYKVNYCAGYCPSTTLYIHQYPWFKTKCFCCKAKKQTESFFALRCINKDGRNVTRHIPRDNVVECKCGHCTPH